MSPRERERKRAVRYCGKDKDGKRGENHVSIRHAKNSVGKKGSWLTDSRSGETAIPEGEPQRNVANGSGSTALCWTFAAFSVY
jgi:hypothetical protein